MFVTVKRAPTTVSISLLLPRAPLTARAFPMRVAIAEARSVRWKRLEPLKIELL